MKKICAALAFTLIAAAFCAAQNKTQTGNATYNADEPYLKAAHADLELGARVRVINMNNKKAVIVTISSRIPSDPSWIVHVGKGAADNIELTRTGTTPVTLEVLGIRRQTSGQADSRNAD